MTRSGMAASTQTPTDPSSLEGDLFGEEEDSMGSDHNEAVDATMKDAAGLGGSANASVASDGSFDSSDDEAHSTNNITDKLNTALARAQATQYAFKAKY